MKTNPNDPAFLHYSCPERSPSYGVSKREYFAAMAMQGIISIEFSHGLDPIFVSSFSIKQADALIEALNKGEK